MSAGRVLLIASQQSDLPAPGGGVGTTYSWVEFAGADSYLRAQPSYDVLVIDDADDVEWRLLQRCIATGYPAPVIALVSPDAGAQAEAALAHGANCCVIKSPHYSEQLRWTCEAALSRRRREVAALTPAARLTTALHHLHEGVLIVDARTRTILSANIAAERLFGTLFATGEPFATHPAYRMIDRAGHALVGEEMPISQTLATERAQIGEQLVLERPDGRQTPVIASTIPVHDAAGVLQEVISVYEELTDQTQAQLVRDEVLSIASHELRTPLTVVLGYSSLLRTLTTADGDPRVQRAITKIYEQSLRMRDLIEHLLDFSRLTLGRVQLQRIEFDLNALVREVGQRQARSEQRALQLALPDRPLAITGDYGRLSQALQQIIHAASQQRERHEVTIAIHTDTAASFSSAALALPATGDRHYALIQVGGDLPAAGHGEGEPIALGAALPPERDLELTISAELVRLHGGALLVGPQNDQGSVFNVILPLQGIDASC